MSYYDHATALAFRLGRWARDRTPKAYEVEVVLFRQAYLAKGPALPGSDQRRAQDREIAQQDKDDGNGQKERPQGRKDREGADT